MKAQELAIKLQEFAAEFGWENAKNNTKGNAIFRDKTGNDAFPDGSPYMGFINPDEDNSGPYSDLSFVVFPQKEGGPCVISIGVGSMGFKDDLEIASLPGFRRSYLQLIDDDGNSFVKSSFLDIENTSKDLQRRINELKELDYVKSLNLQNDAKNYCLTNSIKTYNKVLLASRIINIGYPGVSPQSYITSPADKNDPNYVNHPIYDEDFVILKAWLAKYAEFRGWASNKTQRDSIQKALSEYNRRYNSNKAIDHTAEVQKLLKERKFVVLQGAPGTGKTHCALKIANSGIFEKTEFTQFHAETTYSDFVYGIQPKISSEESQLTYTPKYGVLYDAIKSAQNTKKDVLLIIDEINRANLANVLGPIFYLFEYQRDCSLKIQIGDMELEKLPDNLYVLATMNTADRSLAVVDFALRRRFMWYTLQPQPITNLPPDKFFHTAIYEKVDNLFAKYATDEELNLQPGQSYFITDKKNKEALMKNRLIYEIMPLMKEYFAEGFMLKAKNEFCNLFYAETKLQLYQ